MIHRLAASLAALALSLTLAAPVLAGGWAEIVADAQTSEQPPVEGQPVEVGFVVLQHGVTPAPWETATVHFTNASTGETIDVVATNDRTDGHFVATATLPDAGFWSWQVTLQNLESQHLPIALTVRTAAGEVPAYDPSMTATAIARAKQDVTTEMSNRIYPEIERLDNLLRVEQTKTDALDKQNRELAARVAATEGSAGLPILAVLTLAVLAGAAAGFAMTWLAGRPGPSVTVSPAPRGADPA